MENMTLFLDLLNDDIKFFQYFRMFQPRFIFLVDILKPHLLRQNTTYREAIGPEEMACCLFNDIKHQMQSSYLKYKY